MNWRREQTGWVFHRQGVAWHKMPLKGWLWRTFHLCTPHTTSVHGREVTQRCICGAARFGDIGPARVGWVPKPTPGLMSSATHAAAAAAAEKQVRSLQVQMTSWNDRNSRYRGTALVYRPYVHALEEQP